MKRLVALAVLGFLQCAEPRPNAVLLLRVTVPYEGAEGDRPIASVQINRNDETFDWEGAAWITPTAVEHDLREGRQIEIAVETDSPQASSVAALRVRIDLCEPESRVPCDRDPNTPRLQLLLEHPFYAGELTEFRAAPRATDGAWELPDTIVPTRQVELPRIGQPPVLVSRCSIAGCIVLPDRPGAAFKPDARTGFCRLHTNGTLAHFCEDE